MIRAITYGCPSPVKCLTLADAITHRPWLPPIVRKKARSLGDGTARRIACLRIRYAFGPKDPHSAKPVCAKADAQW
jgi:hypothetical protein